MLWGPDSPWPLSLSFPACRTETAPPGASAWQGASSYAQRGWGRGRECGPQSPWRRPAVKGSRLSLEGCCVFSTVV